MKVANQLGTVKVQIFPVRVVIWECKDGLNTHFTVRDWFSWERSRLVCFGIVERPAPIDRGAFEL